MDRKVFFQASILIYILYALLLVFFVMFGCVAFVCFFALIFIGISNVAVLGFIIFFCGFLFFTYLLIRIARNRIILEEDEICVPEHWGCKNQKIQFETHIPYKDIKDIFFRISCLNSLNQPIWRVYTPMPYLVFECHDGSQKAINVYCFNKKQVITIIDETVRRARRWSNYIQIKSGEELLNEFLSQDKRKKSKKRKQEYN